MDTSFLELELHEQNIALKVRCADLAPWRLPEKSV